MTKTPQVGDVVHVRGTVTQEAIYSGCFLMRPDWSTLMPVGDDILRVPEKAIVHIEPAPLKVGDRVKECNGREGTIIALQDKWAWVDLPSSEWPCTWDVNLLERLP